MLSSTGRSSGLATCSVRPSTQAVFLQSPARGSAISGVAGVKTQRPSVQVSVVQGVRSSQSEAAPQMRTQTPSTQSWRARQSAAVVQPGSPPVSVEVSVEVSAPEPLSAVVSAPEPLSEELSAAVSAPEPLSADASAPPLPSSGPPVPVWLLQAASSTSTERAPKRRADCFMFH